MIAQDLLPGGVTEPAGGGRRVDDVGHQQGGDDSLVLAGHADRLDVSGEVEQDSRLIADHPGVVPGRDVGDVARLELDLLAVIHPDGEPAGKHDLDVVNRA